MRVGPAILLLCSLGLLACGESLPATYKDAPCATVPAPPIDNTAELDPGEPGETGGGS